MSNPLEIVINAVDINYSKFLKKAISLKLNSTREQIIISSGVTQLKKILSDNKEINVVLIRLDKEEIKDPLEFVKRFKEDYSNIKLIILNYIEQDNFTMNLRGMGVGIYLIDRSVEVLIEEMEIQLDKNLKQSFFPLGLGKREKLVFHYLIAGLSYKQIGKILFLSQSTIGTYATRIYEKVKVRGRGGLVIKYSDYLNSNDLIDTY